MNLSLKDKFPASECIEQVADEFFCLSQPADFVSVGMHYENFGQTSDEEVLTILLGEVK